MMQPENQLLLTVSQLAELLQLPRSTTYELLAKNKIPGKIKLGKHCRIQKANVLAWLSGENAASHIKGAQ